MNTPSSFPWLRRLRGVAFVASVALTALNTSATEAAKKSYSIPASVATDALAAFTEQSGEQIVYPVDALRGVRTNAVQGQLSARAALEQLVAGTDLVVVQDASTGALGLRRASDKPAATVAAKDLQPAVKLQEYRVLGSRIRQTDEAGPSPVSTYDADYIRSTGAMTLADFLNYLPQTYSGIGAGRGSTPNELNPEFGQRTETTTPLTNFILGAADAPPGQTGVSGVSLRGLGSGSTLVLVDGRRAAQSGAGNRSSDSRQGFVDLNTIPFGMIDRIEVITDGASAIYGADAVAGVINIVLKKDWKGHELSGSFKGAFHGGGRERETTLTSGFAAGKLRGTVSVSYYDRAPLKASQRSFSKNQDHRGIVAGYNSDGSPIAGRDLRLNWGYPAVVQAQGGVVFGSFDAIPGVRVVLVPEGATTTPNVTQFIPVTTPAPGQSVVNASGQRRGNTAEFIDLIPASQRYSFAGNFTYAVNDRVDVYGSYGYSDTRGFYNTQPAVSSASASSGFGNFSTVVPAAMNPFNQNVYVGLIHYEFGSIWQRTHTRAHSATLGARGKFGQTWEWDSGLAYQKQDSFQLTRSFNGAAITAALNNPDPAQRLNPFIDARAAGVTQAAIYERMAVYPTLTSGIDVTTWDFAANGDVVEVWGGPIQLAFGGSTTRAENSSESVNYSTAATPVVTTSTIGGSRSNYAIFAEASVPLFGKPNAVTLLRRLDLQLAGRYEDYDRAGHTTVPKVGLSWVPVQSLLIRGSYSEGYRAPALTEYQIAVSQFTSTLVDPRRTPASTSGITTFRGSPSSINPETSTNEFYGIVYEPAFAKGLNFQVNYYRTVQKDVVQQLSAQVIVNNEALFPGRVTRAAADSTDTALGQPGRITAVDTTLINFGRVENESMDFQFDYRIPAERLGRWRVGFATTRTLKSTRELAPNAPELVDEGDTFAPPKWKYTGSVFWSSGPWNASAFVSYIGGFATNRAGNTLTASYAIPAVYKVDVRGGYEFKNGVWRGYGKGLRVVGGIGNLFDKEPPFSDTVFGYNGGLHSQYAIGRTYELSFVLPF